MATPPERRDEGWAVRGGLVGGVDVEAEVGGLGRDIVISMGYPRRKQENCVVELTRNCSVGWMDAEEARSRTHSRDISGVLQCLNSLYEGLTSML